MWHAAAAGAAGHQHGDTPGGCPVCASLYRHGDRWLQCRSSKTVQELRQSLREGAPSRAKPGEAGGRG